MSPYSPFVLLTVTPPLWAIEFQFFPGSITQERRANWEPQDVYRGTKPLTYGNQEPQRITIGEVWLDRSDECESISPDIDALFKLQAEVSPSARHTAAEIQKLTTHKQADSGSIVAWSPGAMPPTLLAIWGDRAERVVLEDVNVEAVKFLPGGEPVRARVQLSLLEIHDSITEVTSREVPDTGDAESLLTAPPELFHVSRDIRPFRGPIE